MRVNVTIENVGVIKNATIQLGGLTVLCGKNNSGKTYVTHSIFGLLDRLQRTAGAPILEKIIKPVESSGIVELTEESFFSILQESVDRVSSDAPSFLADVLASGKERFNDSRISLSLVAPRNVYAFSGSHSTPVGSIAYGISKTSSEMCRVTFSRTENPDYAESNEVGHADAIRRFVRRQTAAQIQGQYFPRTFICSAERTGAGIFQRELDFTRSRLIDVLSKSKVSKIDPYDIVGKFVAEYPLAVRTDVDFVRNLPSISNRTGNWAREHEMILKSFADIVGGDYVAQDGDMRFAPKVVQESDMTLKLSESSSSVRALMDMAGYLKHVVRSGDLLIVDEPEMNLHPENQRRIARLLAMLVNTGINVFVTTHSDYLIRELNLLVLLKGENSQKRKLAEKYGYAPYALLDASNVHVYKTEDDLEMRGMKTVSPIHITQDKGMESSVFDDEINEMNRISDDIYWGE
jgi:energy-coupling factor transporter ATP-binding protein EcfA2